MTAPPHPPPVPAGFAALIWVRIDDGTGYWRRYFVGKLDAPLEIAVAEINTRSINIYRR